MVMGNSIAMVNYIGIFSDDKQCACGDYAVNIGVFSARHGQLVSGRRWMMCSA